MKEKVTKTDEEYISHKTVEMIKQLLETNFGKVDKNVFDMRLQATRTAMVFVRDREMMKRIQQAQHLRICTIVYDKQNVEARKDYIEAAMPQITMSKD